MDSTFKCCTSRLNPPWADSICHEWHGGFNEWHGGFINHWHGSGAGIKYDTFDKTLPSLLLTGNGTIILNETISINQRYGKWYNFSAVTVKTVYIGGNLSFSTLSIVPKR